MLSHRDILKTLRKSFPGTGKVSLVARYSDPELSLPGRRTHIFIGDCHLLNKEDAKAYPKWGFKQERDLLTLLRGLTELKERSPGQLRVWQLGDLVDIWRGRSGLGSTAEVDRTTADYPEIIDLLRYGAPYGVGAQIMAGNHDYPLYRMAEWKAARYRIIQNDDPNAGDVLVLHGDVFTWLEGLPDEIQARAVRFAKGHSAGKKELFNEEGIIADLNNGLRDGDRPIGKSKASLASRMPESVEINGSSPVNVIRGDDGNPRAENKMYFAAAKEVAKAMRQRGHNIRLIVIGHTHWARLLTGRIGNSPFALLDCGAWIGYCRLAKSEPWIHSAQIGVLVDNDLRLYQVGRRLMS